MLHVRPVGSGVGPYYLRQGPGVWVGAGRGQLNLEGTVEGGDLRAVLRGHDPASRRFLPEVRAARRRAGWDLVFSAPKSLSLLAATDAGTPPGGGASQIAAAHRDAVGDALVLFEERHLHITRSGAPGGSVASRGAIAARFDHAGNAGGEPHLHSHLMLANLAMDQDGRWWSVGSWWLARRELDAIYVLGLRHHLEVSGVHLDWRVRADGLVDVAGVPRAAVRAASTRGHEAANGGRYTGRGHDTDRPWRQRARAAGWDPAGVGAARDGTPGHPGDLAAAVTARLAVNGSTFGERDVLVALAGLPQARIAAGETRRWVDGFLAHCIPVPGAGTPLWTSPLAEAADRRVVAMFDARIEEPIAPSRTDRTGAMTITDRVLDGGRVVILAAGPRRSGFLAHAAVAAECAREWDAAGMSVAVAARNPIDALRWTTLTGIEAYRPSARTDVVIVDQADRRTAAELAVLVDSARGSKLILVEGGTQLRPARAANRALDAIRRRVPVLAVGEAPAWAVAAAHQPVAAAHQPDAATCLLARWAEHTASAPHGDTAILVALGFPETLALNDAARAHLASLHHLTGPELYVRGRGFRAGDTVVAVRPLGSGLPAGTLGAVQTVDLRSRTATIRWPHRVATADSTALARIGHGYAATPRLAARTEMPALVLGPSEGVGLDRRRVVESFMERDQQVARLERAARRR